MGVSLGHGWKRLGTIGSASVLSAWYKLPQKGLGEKGYITPDLLPTILRLLQPQSALAHGLAISLASSALIQG